MEVILLQVQLQPEGIMLLSQLGHMGSIPYYVASRTVVLVSHSSVCSVCSAAKAFAVTAGRDLMRKAPRTAASRFQEDTTKSVTCGWLKRAR